MLKRSPAAIWAGSQSWAAVGVKCIFVGSDISSMDNPERHDDTLSWDFAGDRIPDKFGYGFRGFQYIEGGLVSGYWVSDKRLWLKINITDNGKVGGVYKEQIVIKAVKGGRNSALRYQGKAFFKELKKTYDVACVDGKLWRDNQ